MIYGKCLSYGKPSLLRRIKAKLTKRKGYLKVYVPLDIKNINDEEI